MLSSVKDRLDRDDEGFTLIELMVVVLIIAILLAIAIPTFLGARGQANSRAAQSSLRNALTAEQTYYTNNQAFDDTTGTPSITSIEPNLGWKQATAANMPSTMSENANTVYVTLAKVTSTNDTVVLQGYAKDGNCYSVYQTNGTTSNAATGYAVTKGYCQAPTLTAGTAANPTSGSAGSNIPTAAGAPSAWYTTW